MMNTNHLSELGKASLVFVPIFSFLFGLAAYSLFLGVTNYAGCSLESFLPQGLIGFGFLGSICIIAALILTIYSFLQVNGLSNHLLYLLYALIALVGYTLTATILAIATAFTLYTEHSPRDAQSICQTSIYNFCSSFPKIVISMYVVVFIIWFIRFVCTDRSQANRRKNK